MATAFAKFTLSMAAIGGTVYAFTEYRYARGDQSYIEYEKSKKAEIEYKDVKRRMDAGEIFPPSEDG